MLLKEKEFLFLLNSLKMPMLDGIIFTQKKINWLPYIFDLLNARWYDDQWLLI